MVVFGFIVAYFYSVLVYGGFRGLISEFRDLPSEARLVQMRSDVAEDLAQEHSEFSSIDGLTFYKETHSDVCVKGEHGWKRSNSFAYLCSYRITYYYGTSRDYYNLLLEIEEFLDGSDWKIQNTNPPRKTISEAISENLKEAFLADLPIYTKKNSTNNNTMYLRVNNFPGRSSGWKELAEEPFPFMFGFSRYQIVHQDQSSVSPNEIFQDISSAGQQRLMIVISEDYFRN